MEPIIQTFIYIHAFFGTIGLLSGTFIFFAKKGSKFHKKTGKLFSISMLISVTLSLPICWLPNHKNLFLFLIGLFSIYLIITGNRAIHFKNRNATSIDYLISGIMLIASSIMVILGVVGLITHSGSILYLFFGLIGGFLSLRDFTFYRSTNHKKYLLVHIGKIVGAYIASVTAFIVAAIGLGHILAWILPTVFGTVYIIYWIKKMKTKLTV